MHRGAAAITLGLTLSGSAALAQTIRIDHTGAGPAAPRPGTGST
jgi:hypothetical protein